MKTAIMAAIVLFCAIGILCSGIVSAGPVENVNEFMKKAVVSAEKSSANRPVSGDDYIEWQEPGSPGCLEEESKLDDEYQQEN